MTLQVALTHRTAYQYDRKVAMGPHIIRLRPAPHARTPILSYSQKLSPSEHFINWQQDPFGNYMARLIIPEKTDHFSVTIDLVAELEPINPFDFFIADEAKEWPFSYPKEDKVDLLPYLIPIPAGPLLTRYLKKVEAIKEETTLDFIVAVNRMLEQDISYLIRLEPGVQTPEKTLKNGSGSCRDTGWLLVQIFRHLGLAARFVSGYLIQLKADQESLDGPSGAAEDFTDLHAWTEVYVPGAGWIGLDPTSGLLAAEGHIPLAATPHPVSAAPITGALDEAEVEFDFHMEVTRIKETPRVTLPYSDEAWDEIKALGDKVDQVLQKDDVRLTMGGEPTFVSIDDMEGDEWNTAAVGPTKRFLAENLARRLQKKFAPGGLMHYGQGKWYPGEQLPRWSFSIYWRDDEEPLWLNHDLIDTEKPKHTIEAAQAEEFAKELCSTLGLDSDVAIPAFEDPAHFMLVEQKLPLNVDVTDPKLKDPQERRRVVKVFERGLDKPAGFVLPIQVWHSKDRRRWVTERWRFRRDKLFLMPGDSPVGFRLPLQSLDFIPQSGYPHVLPRDPFDPRTQMPKRAELVVQRKTETLKAPEPPKETSDEVTGAVRTALSIEPRNNHLCVFMPPLEDAEDYAALIAAIEETAKAVDLPVHIEGYEPPFDPRLNVIKVTPDPGVIEVNIHPSKNWKEAVATTEILYEEARLSRLGTEKFMLDGKHSGTGGGNHIVLGGKAPEHSPFLRRPDLLASLIRYWQCHPSLSYLFSGLFIGPTSQAPRVDEARHEGLYELEIALNQVPEPGSGQIPHWLVDRLFRNLLIDVTGNTHRAEICIDKLYSPDGPTGRLGLVEFRSFEMPPHARMSLAQQLLLRAIIARLWKHPFKGRLIRWGTALHDKFMLPHFVWSDFEDVIDDLNRAGFPIKAEWFRPHAEFRFPVIGTYAVKGIGLEVRSALEPWNVLGEEGAVGGTARYVDSSLERVQVKVTGDQGGRFQLACNTVPVPLQPTGRAGEFVAGIRYRAWQPWSALHPTIGVHSPLTFDVVDTWTGRSVGGCRYHVSHPGGKSSDRFPINSFEAAGRRRSRFETIGHTSGAMSLNPPVVDRDYPHTLDLRRF